MCTLTLVSIDFLHAYDGVGYEHSTTKRTFFLKKKTFHASMHSSRMRTARSLPCREVYLCRRGLCPGGLFPGGLFPEGSLSGRPPGRSMGPGTETLLEGTWNRDRNPLEGTWDQGQRPPPQKKHGARVRDPAPSPAREKFGYNEQIFMNLIICGICI